MGEEETVANEVIAEEKKVDDNPQKMEEGKDVVDEMEKDAKDGMNVETQKMDVDSASKEDKETEAEARNEVREEIKEEMDTEAVSKEDKTTKEEEKEESRSKQEEVEKSNDVNEKKKEGIETDHVSKDEAETIEEEKEEIASKQDERETVIQVVEERNDVDEDKKEEMEIDPVSQEDAETKEEEKEEIPSKHEEGETVNEVVGKKNNEKKPKENGTDEVETEAVNEPMEEDKDEQKNEIKEEVKVKKSKREKEKSEDGKQDPGKKSRTKGDKSAKKEIEEKKIEPKTPATLASDRPVRERKSVERLVALIEEDSIRDFQIKKGRGTAFKDIPNVAFKISQKLITHELLGVQFSEVAFKLSKRKAGDETLKLLHTILFGRRAKADQVKSNISQFSGFVWNENEEKQKIKIKEKLDKSIHKKLVEFCYLLDLPVAKADGKEDIIVKLIEFLMVPKATTTELLAEKEQSSKGTKRKRTVKGSGSQSLGSPSKRPAKSRVKTENASKKGGKVDTTEKDHEESDDTHEQEDEQEEEEYVNEKSKSEVSESSESEEKNVDMEEASSGEEEVKKKCLPKKTSVKKESMTKTKAKKVATPKKSTLPTKKTPAKSSSSKQTKIDDSSDTSPKGFSRKKETDNEKEKAKEKEKEKTSTPKPATKEKIERKVVKAKGKPREEKLKPSDAELKKAICKILTEVDFNTATFTDILKLLAGRFKSDFTSRKSSIKAMIQDELTKLAEEAGSDEDEEEVEEEPKLIRNTPTLRLKE